MLSHCLFVLLLSFGTASSVYYDNTVDNDDFNGTFIVFDVKADKHSAGNLKTAFNQLRNPEYAVKSIGEERALFIVRDDNACETLQADFNGLKVESLIAKASQDSFTFNETGLVVMIIFTSLDDDARNQAFDDALAKCGNCFKVFTVLGRKPQKVILIGNIPLDQVSEIANSTTTDKCCDTVSTRRAIDFNTAQKQHSLGCIDTHPTALKAVHKPVPHPVHRGIDVHRFPDNVHDGHIPIPHKNKTPPAPHKDNFPPAPHNGQFPPTRHNGQFFPGQSVDPHGIENPNFKFPNLRGRGYRANNYNPHINFDPQGYGEQRSYL